MRFSDILFLALAAGFTSAAPAADSKIAEKRADNNLDALFQNYYAVPPAKRAEEANKRGEEIKRADNNLDALFQNYYAVPPAKRAEEAKKRGEEIKKRADNNLDALFQNYYAVPPKN